MGKQLDDVSKEELSELRGLKKAGLSADDDIVEGRHHGSYLPCRCARGRIPLDSIAVLRYQEG
ncbi:MAG: hypothetical protein WCD51_15935 [Anaerolineae bacterium]|jgi:hypothetical protein